MRGSGGPEPETWTQKSKSQGPAVSAFLQVLASTRQKMQTKAAMQALPRRRSMRSMRSMVMDVSVEAADAKGTIVCNLVKARDGPFALHTAGAPRDVEKKPPEIQATSLPSASAAASTRSLESGLPFAVPLPRNEKSSTPT